MRCVLINMSGIRFSSYNSTKTEIKFQCLPATKSQAAARDILKRGEIFISHLRHGTQLNWLPCPASAKCALIRMSWRAAIAFISLPATSIQLSKHNHNNFESYRSKGFFDDRIKQSIPVALSRSWCHRLQSSLISDDVARWISKRRWFHDHSCLSNAVLLSFVPLRLLVQ